MNLKKALSDCSVSAQTLGPGLMSSAVVAVAAMFLAQHYGAPVMLFALLLGMAMHFLGDDPRTRPGIEFASKTVLRMGVALLGLRMTWAQVTALGWPTVALVVGGVLLTIVVGIVTARLMGFNRQFGLLTGGAVGICGASAALALSAALPAHAMKERATLFTVIGVSALSTLAMVFYPMVADSLALGPQSAGIFLGGTIHDVAQVVGAGYGMSQETGDAAAVVKLLRVAMLLPVIVVVAGWTRAQTDATSAERPPLLPWFVIAFAILVAVNSWGILPRAIGSAGRQASQWCLVVAIAGLGMKTQLREIARVGIKPVMLMLLETLFLAALVFVGLSLQGRLHL